MMTLPIGMLIEGVEPFVQDCDPKPELGNFKSNSILTKVQITKWKYFFFIFFWIYILSYII